MNEFYDQIQKAYNNNASKDELIKLLSRGRAKKGIFEGDLVNGELEIGQISSNISEIKPVREIINDLVVSFNKKLDFLSTKLM